MLLLITFFISSCGEKKNNEVISNIKEKELTKELVVKIKYKTNQPDDFKIMLNHVEVDEFQSKNIHIIEKVFATSNTDLIVAKFGDKNISNRFQIGLGNKEPKKVEMESIDFFYIDKTLSIMPDEIGEYFRFNEFVAFDPISNDLTTKRVNGKHFPVMSLKWKYLDNLIKRNEL